MSIFKVQLDEALARLATPPTRRHGGTRLRSSIALQSPIELLHTESKVLPESDQGGRAAGDGRGGRTPAHGDGWAGAAHTQSVLTACTRARAACTVRRVRTAHTPGGVLESPAGTTTSSTRVHDFKVRPTA